MLWNHTNDEQVINYSNLGWSDLFKNKYFLGETSSLSLPTPEINAQL